MFVMDDTHIRFAPLSNPRNFNPNKTGLFEGTFFRGQFDSPFIFQEELIQYHYSFIQWLNNLYKVG